MNRTASRTLRHSLAATMVAALLAACTDGPPVGPDGRSASRAARAETEATTTGRGVDLTGCEQLQAPAGSVLSARIYARGDQIYRWNGSAWSFVGPEATLYADAEGTGVVGTHYAGPRWKSNSGGVVKGTLRDRCTPDTSAIDWLLLDLAAEEGVGLFQRAVAVQRVNTVGGKAPTAAGALGEVRRVAYTAEYLFYQMP
jgi:hypothetical protein